MTEQELLDLFEQFDLTAEEDEEINRAMPQFAIYQKHGKTAECFCTLCRDVYDVKASAVKHNKVGVCPRCGEEVRFMAGGKIPVKSYSDKSNFVVFRAVDDMLLAKCYLVYQYFDDSGYYNGITEYMPELTYTETQRYVFGKSGAYRFIPDVQQEYDKTRGYHVSKIVWKRSKTLREPCFYNHTQLGYVDNSYNVISVHEYQKSCMRYCGLDDYIYRDGNYPISYLCRLAKYPALEKLTKCGYEYIVDDIVRPSGVYKTPALRLNLRSDDPRKILRLDREEMELLRGCNPAQYRKWLDFRGLDIPGSTSKRFEVFNDFGGLCHEIKLIAITTGLSHIQVINYVKRQTAAGMRYSDIMHDWSDYLGQCRELGYDVHDTAVSKPRSLGEKHGQLTALIQTKKLNASKKQFDDNIEWRKRLEYHNDEYIIRQPESIEEIVAEGAVLHHCVGGYARQHAEGFTTIMFLRKADDPGTPYYTIEITKDLKIQQCRGYANNVLTRGGVDKPPEIYKLEQEYQEYLYSIDWISLKRLMDKAEVRKGA